MPDRISIHPADPAWREEYARERGKIERALGRAGLRYEHVGSTAVPGLAAKPTIDVLIGSSDGGVDAAARRAFEGLGYDFLGEHGVPDRRLFRKGLPPSHHVHWTTAGGAFWTDQLLFRDFLRSHPAESAQYEELKRGLAARFEHERERYTAAKAGFIGSLLQRARAQAGGRRVVFDLEATCWETGTAVERQEIIEIGAVELDASLAARREFRAFVRPTREPELSGFCRALTGIAQSDVDQAQPIEHGLDGFAAWIAQGQGPFELCSWGAYDMTQLVVECGRLGRPLPAGFERHVDLRALFSRARGGPLKSTEQALAALGLAPENARHRALDDAREISRLARVLLSPVQ